jgi:polyphosphate kinase 2
VAASGAAALSGEAAAQVVGGKAGKAARKARDTAGKPGRSAGTAGRAGRPGNDGNGGAVGNGGDGGDVPGSTGGPGPARISKADAERELARLQTELVRLQEWIVHAGLRVIVVMEGRDTAGKGGTIKRITERLNPRHYRVVALGTPTERERTQWYFQRYVEHFPAAGEIVFFDRSWYNRAGVERVMGFCTDAEYDEFVRTCPQLERALVRSGIILVKYWLSVSDGEQERRFRARITNPDKRWKLSAMDLQSRAHWVDYAEAKDEMFAYTDIREAPWYVVDAEDKREARLNLISHLLAQIPYEEVPQPAVVFPPRQERAYRRPPIDSQTWVPRRYLVR